MNPMNTRKRKTLFKWYSHNLKESYKDLQWFENDIFMRNISYLFYIIVNYTIIKPIILFFGWFVKNNFKIIPFIMQSNFFMSS
jgi:hypothetical protein